MNLAELIRSTKGDRSYEDLSRASGAVITRQRWYQLATTNLKEFPEPATIQAIAGSLGVGQRAVVLAIASSLGLDVDRGLSRLEQMLPATTDNLNRDEEAAVLGILRVLTSRKTGEGSGEQPAATKTARDYTGRTEVPAPSQEQAMWDRRAAPLREAGYTERAIVHALGGPRPGDVGENLGGAGHIDAGHSVDDRRRRRSS